jgi:hypothetical protein
MREDRVAAIIGAWHATLHTHSVWVNASTGNCTVCDLVCGVFVAEPRCRCCCALVCKGIMIHDSHRKGAWEISPAGGSWWRRDTSVLGETSMRQNRFLCFTQKLHRAGSGLVSGGAASTASLPLPLPFTLDGGCGGAGVGVGVVDGGTCSLASITQTSS